jgi:hypothetical protein
MIQASHLPPAEYVYLAGTDTPDNRQTAEQAMRRNGCRSWRFEKRVQPDESILIACLGYLADIDVSGINE